MAMGTRKKRERQEGLWYSGEMPTAPGHPFYKRLNEILDKTGLTIFARRAARVSTTQGWDARHLRRAYTSAS